MKQTLAQLIQRFRKEACDNVEAYLFDDEFIKDALNEAVHEAAIRARLLFECENSAICEIALVQGRSEYPLHESLFEITHLVRSEVGQPDTTLELKSQEWLDRNWPDWRTDDKSVLPYAIKYDTRLRLATPAKAPGILRLEGYRLPLTTMEADSDTPEIHSAHHEKLVYWALHRGFSQPDADRFDSGRAATALDVFNDYFGLRPDADLRRTSREDLHHANVSYF